MQRLIECVPNFSEGRDRSVLDAIAGAIRAVNGVELLDVDPGADTHRTVMTFVGAPEVVVEAAFQAIKTASQLIDMRLHRGAHPRMGATDVCPLIPIEGVEIEECVRFAEQLGERVARELQIPVYLYEHAARSEARRNLASIRAGEYEGLASKMTEAAWKPDFGEAFNARSGATVIGVREFLIAYNVNLNTTDKKLANDIALSIRETGRLKRDDDGVIVKGADGAQVREAGLLRHVKAVGWYIESYRQAQVSINLTNFKVTPPHVVFEAIRSEAEKRGLLVTGSELVGLIPLDALLVAGRFYLQKQGRSVGASEEELVEMAIRSLGLDQLAPFDAQQKVVEYRIRKLAGPLASMPVRAFTNLTASDAPAPGGGSVAALTGALASALVSMVANLTANGLSVYQRRKPDGSELFASMSTLAERAQRIKDRLLSAIDRDTEAFNVMMDAMRDKSEQRAARLLAATRAAIAVPMEILLSCQEICQLAQLVGERGNPNALSDAGVAGALALAAAQGAWYNVLINLRDVTDADYVTQTRTEGQLALDRVRAMAADIERLMEKIGNPAPVPAAAGAGTPDA